MHEFKIFPLSKGVIFYFNTDRYNFLYEINKLIKNIVSLKKENIKKLQTSLTHTDAGDNNQLKH